MAATSARTFALTTSSLRASCGNRHSLRGKAIGDKNPETLARDLLAMGDEEFRSAFRRSPMKRAKRRGLVRNAAVVLGNSA